MRTFSYIALGCKVNQYEAAQFASALCRLGLAPANPGEHADLCVVRACAVTTAAMRKSRLAIRAASADSDAVVVTGCWADDDFGLRISDYGSEGNKLPGAAIFNPKSEIRNPKLLMIPNLDQAGAIRRLVEWVGQRQRPEHDPATQAAGLGLSAAKGWIRPASSSTIGHGQRPATTHIPNIVTTPLAVKSNFDGTADPVSDYSTGNSVSQGCHTLSGFSRQGVPSGQPGTHLAPDESGGKVWHPASLPGHARAFVKVQDGCDARCAFCIVPTLRPVLSSRPIEQVVDEVRALAAGGFREIVLAGIFLGAFGRPTAIRRRWAPDFGFRISDFGLKEDAGTPEPSASGLPFRETPADQEIRNRHAPLLALLDAVRRVPGVGRIRLSSLEPGDVTDELLALLAADPIFAPHLHLPLQSGSDRILRRMNRQYDLGEFVRTIQRVRAALDRPAVTTDIIVGFPGETEADFETTLAVARDGGFARIHAFRYSPRPGTPACLRGDQPVDPRIVRDRLARLAALASQLSIAFRRQFVGQLERVAIEYPDPRTPGIRRGRSGRYFMVRFAEREKTVGRRGDGPHLAAELAPPAESPQPSAAGLPFSEIPQDHGRSLPAPLPIATVRIERVDPTETWGEIVAIDD